MTDFWSAALPCSGWSIIGDATGLQTGIDASALQAILEAECQKAADIVASRTTIACLLSQL